MVDVLPPLRSDSQHAPMPQDYEEQVELAMRIFQSAFTGKVRALQSEIVALKHGCDEQRNTAQAMQQKNSALEERLADTQQTAKQLYQENQELLAVVSSLRSQMKRLEALRSAVMTSIQADDAMAQESPVNQVVRDDFLCERLPLSMRGLSVNGPLPSSKAVGDVGAATSDAGHPGQQGCPQADATHAEAPVDGRQFFREARSRLSTEAFNLFLASIKRLNNQEQSREETLDEAWRVFGDEHQDLYRSFEHLLNRQGV